MPLSAPDIRRTLRLLRLSDGRDVMIRVPGRGWVEAQIERPGVFYSYTAPESELVGRVAFVPARDLSRRLGPGG